ncbi:hypothetical protein [Streptomyces sp. B93]|uniref:hypothetical protein n=1 Tax=Streptomyces sp. B93 TaxID=2824875 RepID=UPI001B37E734|nr:hypothetical protein [Streptomyces sp. B93]MBQ1094075.1 hypothetical protein [Streptomyces sp. B93]
MGLLMLPEFRTGPTRADVEAQWRALIEGRLSRQDVHVWAAQWVGVPEARVVDPMVENGLLHLHGFSMESPSAGAAKTYMHPDDAVTAALERWRRDCVRFDQDPVGFLSERRAAARAYAAREAREESERD